MNKEMLDKTLVFLDAVKAYFDKEGMQVRFGNAGRFVYNIFIANEIWQLYNDGKVASITLVGHRG